MKPFVLPLACGAFFLSGCAKGPSSGPTTGAKSGAGKRAEGRPEKERTVNLAGTAGTAYRRDAAKNLKLYTISWKGAAVTLGQAGLQEGKMNGVSGTVYEGEKPKSTFTADTAYAKKETQTLFLEGRVIVKSPAYKAVLKARKLEWLPDVKCYRATGDVTITTPTVTMGPSPVLVASSDLKRFGTPDSFKAQ